MPTCLGESFPQTPWGRWERKLITKKHYPFIGNAYLLFTLVYSSKVTSAN